MGGGTACITATESGEYWPLLVDSNGNVDTSLAAMPTTVIVHDPSPQVSYIVDTVYVSGQYAAYQWYFLDSLIVGATDSFIVAPQGTSSFCCYRVVVIDSFGCVGNSYCIEFGDMTSCLTSVEEQGANLFQIYPNPATTHITLSAEEGSINTITLFDLTGKEVSFPPLLSETEKSITLDVSGLPSGIYFGQVFVGENRRNFIWVKQ